jgi:hypothetical protein
MTGVPPGGAKLIKFIFDRSAPPSFADDLKSKSA